MTQIVNPYTRKIDKEYQRLLFKSAIVNTDKDGNQNFTINPSDIQDAKDYLVQTLFGLSKDEVENLGIKEYETMSKEADKFIASEKGGSNAGSPAKVPESNK